MAIHSILGTERLATNMKQYITHEQLGELTNTGQDNLIKWLNSCDYDYYKSLTEPFELLEPRLSIGQMIEFLFDNDFGPIITSNDSAFYWIIEPEKKLACWSKYIYENEELCDALWEAVISILNNK